uniref:Histone-lysine N-methyltransferase, H3 lysine-79 specific n=1 Tax=Ascaris lumbricoides TaxID=6252 RepID=A0A9J2P870_ASCLU
MEKMCDEQDAMPSSSEPPDVKEVSLKEANRPGPSKQPSSCSSSRSKASSTPPSANDSDKTERIAMKLASPVGGEAFTFYWPLRESDGYSEGQEILDLLKETLTSFPELEFIVRRKCDIGAVDKRDYQQMSFLLDTFNKTIPTITQLWKGATKPGGEIWSAERAEPSLLKHICARAYNRAVDNVHLLNNHYKAFSSQTYGETSFERMQMIIEEIVPKERDVFVDLGSGVGQLVIHMAGGSRVKKAVGIEVATLPCKYADNLGAEFKKWMKWYGKKFRPFELLVGDFLSEQFRDLITKEATIIFINNYAFTAMLESRIKRELLSELKDGTRIISTKPYGTPNRSITDRQLNDISAILDVYEMVECENACSWTGNYVPYYHHTINRAKLEKYFLSQRNPILRQDGSDGSRRSSTSSKASRGSAPGSSNGSRESSVSLPPRRSATPMRAVGGRKSRTRSKSPNPRTRSPACRHSDDDDEHAIGPTTRRKWQEYCSTKSRLDKLHPHGSVTSSESDPANVVTKWPTPDTEYLPPSAKKRKTGAGRGRPRKNPLPPKTIREETKEAIELMHDMTRTATARPTSPVHESSLVVTDLSSSQLPVAPPSEADGTIAQAETLHSSKYPALNLLLEWLRKCFEEQIELMNCPDYMMHITNQIDCLRIQQAAMHARIDSLTKQISQLLASGVSSLYARLDELGIEASTPSLLLESAKDIVARHKKITAECAALENEITALDLSNQQMEVRKRRREESASGERPLYAVSSSLTLAENCQALENQNKNIMSRIAALAAKMEVLPNGDGTTIAQGHDVLMSATTEVHPTYTTALPTSAYNIPRTIAAAAPTSTNALKRARSRSVRGGSSNKRVVSSSAKLPNDPKEEEEMERKIQDIVAKALEVDSAAKCAEKERRARGEKRKEKTTSVSSVVSGMRRTDDFSGVQSRAPNVTSIPEGVPGPMMSPTRAFDGGTVTVPPAALMTTAELESARSDED